MTFARDTYRAVLVVAVVAVLRGDIEFPTRPVAATPPVETSQPRPWQPAPPIAPSPPPMQSVQWQPPQPVVFYQPPEQRNDKPLRRIGSAFIELGDSVIGAIRR